MTKKRYTWTDLAILCLCAYTLVVSLLVLFGEKSSPDWHLLQASGSLAAVAALLIIMYRDRRKKRKNR